MMQGQIGLKLALVGGLTLSVAGVGWAQSTTQGAIGGTVFDATNAVVPGAKVLIHNDGTNAEMNLVSDSAGFYKAPQLPPGHIR